MLFSAKSHVILVTAPDRISPPVYAMSLTHSFLMNINECFLCETQRKQPSMQPKTLANTL